MPSTEPNMPPAMKAPVSVARRRAREDTQDDRDADAAVGRLADAHEETRREHLFVALRETARERGEAPQQRHDGQAVDAAPAIGEQRQREGQHSDHQRDDAAQRAELSVAQVPFRLEQREHGIEHLSRHVVGQQQGEREREHDPRERARAAHRRRGAARYADCRWWLHVCTPRERHGPLQAQTW